MRCTPGARPRSHPQQVEAIVNTAEAMEIGCLIYQPDEIWWGNELAKRNKSIALAATVAEKDDWITVIDADYHLLRCNPDVIRHELEETDLHVAAYTLLDGKDFLATAALEQYAVKTNIDTEWTIRTRDMYRWNPTLQVGPAHWCYSAVVDDRRRWLRGPYNDLLPELELGANLVFYHRTQDRALIRRESAGVYYKAREEHKIEFLTEYV